MKHYYIAAAALLVGTSAMAWQPKDAGLDSKDSDKVVTAAWDGAEMAKASDYMAKSDFDTVKSGAMPAAWDDLGEPKLIPASTVTWDDDLAKTDDMKVETAAVDPMAGDPDLDLTEQPVDDTVVTDTAVVDDSQPAIGGPLEDATTGDINMAAADLATRPATQNYPPCRPGPGDDNCIQLYEPGVQTALASWNRPTGGLAGETQAAMGGPYEPVDEATAETAMNGDGDVDMALGETEQSETAGL
jgi:hypothetical protein